MYFCGPTVYQRIHVGNARPFVISMWLEALARAQRLRRDARREHHRHQRQDLRRRRPGASAELAERRDALVPRGHERLGLGRPDHEPKATETIPEIVALIEELVARGLAYGSSGDVYFRVAQLPRLRAALRPAPRRGCEGAGAEPAQGGPARLRALEGEQAGRGHVRGTRRGGAAGRAGTSSARRWPRSTSGRSFEIHGGGLDLVFPHHENELAQSRALGREFAQIWMHNGMLQLAGEKMSKSLGNIVTLREALDEWGRETLLVFFLTGHWRKPIDFSDETLQQAAAQAEGFRNVFRQPVASRRATWEAFAAALDDDFNTPEALAVMHGWRDHELLRRGARGLRPRVAGRGATTAPAESCELAEQRARGARARATSTRPTGCATRSRPPAGRCATCRRAASGSCRAVTPELVYGRRAGARGAARAARGARALGDRAGAEGGAVARARRGVARPRQARARADRGGGHARPPGRRRVLSSRTATPTPTSSPPGERRCSSASTRSPTRATSARSAAAPRARARPASSSRRTARRA